MELRTLIDQWIEEKLELFVQTKAVEKATAI